MGNQGKDEPLEDRTLSVPPRGARPIDPLKKPDPGKAPATPRPPAPSGERPAVHRPERASAAPPSKASGSDHDEPLGTLLPPRAIQSRSPRTPVPPQEPEPKKAPSPGATSKPSTGSRSSDPGFAAHRAIDPGWDEERVRSGLEASGPASPKSKNTPPQQQMDFQPWTFTPSDAPAPQIEHPCQDDPDSGSEFLSEPSPTHDDPKTPPSRIQASRAAGPSADSTRRSLVSAEDTSPTMSGFLFTGAAAPNRFLMLQFFDGDLWRELEQVKPEGHTLGRDSFRRGTSPAEFLAEDHLRLSFEGDRLFAEEGETLNGVYLRVTPDGPVELVHGSRFQVGNHVIELQLAADEPAGIEPVVGPGGEVFRSRQLAPQAFLDFIGPDNRPGLRFPLTKPEGTIIGREGDGCDIALAGDKAASRNHARVVCRHGKFVLEDLKSKNGTYVRIIGRTLIHVGRDRSAEGSDVLLVGKILVRVVEI